MKIKLVFTLFYKKNENMKTTVFDYLIKEKILTESEFRDLFSVRAFRLNNELLLNPKEKVEKGEKITIGFKELFVK